MIDKRFTKESVKHKIQVSVYGDVLHMHISKKELLSLFPEAQKLNVVVSEDNFNEDEVLLSKTF